MVSFELLPAIDVSDGEAIRGRGISRGSAVSYGDPVAAALGWQAAGASWIHAVDLDAAFGRGSNADVLAEIVNSVDIPVQVSGGVRDAASLRRALDTGCARVNLSTAALANIGWCAAQIGENGNRVAMSLDVLGSTLVARGSTEEVGDFFETLAALQGVGCACFVVTDVTRDGSLAGPNLRLLREVCAATDRPVVASGGVASLADLRALAELGVEGAIVGQALYAGAFTLEEALAAVAGGSRGAPPPTA